MEYLILNEESIPFCSNKEADSKFPVFLTLIDLAFSNNLKTIRTSGIFDTGWFEFPLSNGYVLRDWLENQEKDYKTKIKSIISKTTPPIIPDGEERIKERYKLSEFHLSENLSLLVPSLGAIYLLNQLAISFDSNKYWNHSSIHVQHYEINEITEEESKTQIEVKNISKLEHWSTHLKTIQEEIKDSIKNGKALWGNRKEWFPNLVFCGKTEKQLKKFSFSASVKEKTWHVLEKLNDLREQNHSLNIDMLKEVGLDISPESQSVINNSKLKQLREYRLPNGKKEYFEWHIKNIPRTRLYLKFNTEGEKIFIGYIGNHLPTARD